jgi:hypothetical protein
MNITVPVAADGLTVAVKATEPPYVDGFGNEVKFIVVAGWLTVRETTFDVDVLW